MQNEEQNNVIRRGHAIIFEYFSKTPLQTYLQILLITLINNTPSDSREIKKLDCHVALHTSKVKYTGHKSAV